MSKAARSLAAPASVAVGAAKDCMDLTSMRLSLAGTFDASYQVEVSYDNGTTFIAYGALQVDAAFEMALPDAATQVRLRCTEWTSGTPTGAFAGIRS